MKLKSDIPKMSIREYIRCGGSLPSTADHVEGLVDQLVQVLHLWYNAIYTMYGYECPNVAIPFYYKRKPIPELPRLLPQSS